MSKKPAKIERRKKDDERRFYRSFDLKRETINAEARTVELAFSSETEAVERDFGIEILDHGAQSIRLGRLQNSAPLLVGHDSDDHVGVVVSVSVGADRVARAVVRFGKSVRADEIFQDVIDGIRPKVSVGYLAHERVETDEGTEHKPVIRVTDWEPYEISIVSIPADDSVGVGRAAENLNNSETIMPEEITQSVGETTERAAPANQPVVDVTSVREDARRDEMDRIDTIRKMGEKFSCDDLARAFIDTGKSADAMRNAVLDQMSQRQEDAAGPVLGLTGQEVRNYSVIRAVRAAMLGDWKDAGLERESSIAIAEQLGRDARGFFVPFEVQQRVMTAGVNAAGGFAVGTDHLDGSFIDRLRAESLLGRLGARYLPGLVGDVDIPRLDGGATFGWIAEDADSGTNDGVLGSIALSPKTIAGSIPISRRLLKQSSPSIDAMLMQDMAEGAGLGIDLAGFEGTGAANQPSGITVTSGVGTSTIASPGAPTHAELVEFETDVAAANGLKGNLAYVTTAGVRGSLKTTAKDAGSGIMLMENGEANGYKAEVSTQLSANRIIFGNFNDVVIGLWGVLDLMPDQATKAASGGLVLRAFQDVDIGIRHAGSFSINA
ncbi:phage major capsid protein [uncultured Paraglaciecola sp.]|uniref:phage major capsid protein n=1 Tax=uncultured Paraglaciecola sp. TaxID=1765024 RepID=UPI002603CB28|nr:phage major capsid protein [uncultured Paraglaciecola sp.]